MGSDGTHLGWLDHVRYERYADHPDEIVVRRRGLLARRRCGFPFNAVKAVKPRERTVVLHLAESAPEPSGQADRASIGRPVAVAEQDLEHAGAQRFDDLALQLELADGLRCPAATRTKPRPALFVALPT